MSKFSHLLLCCITLLLLVGLTQAVASRAETSQGDGATNSLIEGTVVEIMNTEDGYTYVCLENNGQTNWAVTRGAAVEVGDEAVIASGSTMVTDFESETLGRTFDTIIFTNEIVKR